MILLFCLCASLSGCWVALAGAGAEAGYIAAQEDRSTSETLKDQAIVTSVKTKLLANSDVSGLDINVDSFKGVVTLKGVVDSQNEAETAIRLAWSVSGVKDVQSKLFVE